MPGQWHGDLWYTFRPTWDHIVIIIQTSPKINRIHCELCAAYWHCRDICRCCDADCEMIQMFTNSNVLMKCDFYVCCGNFIQNANKMKVIHPSPGFEEVISVAGKIFSGFYFAVTWPGLASGLAQPGGWAPLWGRNWLPCPDQSRCQGARDRDTTPLSQHSKHRRYPLNKNNKQRQVLEALRWHWQSTVTISSSTKIICSLFSTALHGCDNIYCWYVDLRFTYDINRYTLLYIDRGVYLGKNTPRAPRGIF